MATAEPIVIDSSSPLPDRSSFYRVGVEKHSSQKENVWPSPKSQNAKSNSPQPPFFQGTPNKQPIASTTFKIPPKYSPSKPKPGPSHDAGIPPAKKPRLEAPEPRRRAAAKKQTKSRRTVTGIALDRYDDFEDLDADGAIQTSLNLEPHNKAADAGPANESSTKPQTKIKKATKARKKVAEPAKPRLLDPETANRTIGRQDVFFGTSSQLVRDETLGEVRDLQEALRQSEAAESAHSDVRSKAQRLWGAGARSDEGALVGRDHDAIRGATLAFRDADFIDIDDGTTEPANDHNVNQTLRPAIGSHSRKSALMCVALGHESLAKQSTIDHVAKIGRPKSSGLHDAVKDANAGPKPGKRPRGRPRKNVANIAVGANTSDGTTSKVSNPTEAVTSAAPIPEADFVDIEEIEDVEGDGQSGPGSPTAKVQAPTESESKSTNKRRRRKATSKVAPTSAQEIRNWETEAPILYRLITQAVRSAPSGSGLCKLSWHEKMLLYDPICLEDLTEWLNGGPLQQACNEQDAASETRWEGQAEVWKVKYWCEQHSVCCYGKDASREKR